MNDVRMPIETIREGNKITKVCVEDYYKILNRIAEAEERSAKAWDKIWDNTEVEVPVGDCSFEGCLIVGKGVSQPVTTDTFDEEIGNNIAFMKAKLNANMKKRNVLINLWNAAMITIDAIDEEIDKIDGLIHLDLVGLRKYNPDYLDHLDDFGYEIQEESK